MKRFFFFSFIVDVCIFLEEYIYTEGFFRKLGFVIRLKVLKVSIFLNDRFLFVLFFDLVFIIEIFRIIYELLIEIEFVNKFLW